MLVNLTARDEINDRFTPRILRAAPLFRFRIAAQLQQCAHVDLAVATMDGRQNFVSEFFLSTVPFGFFPRDRIVSRTPRDVPEKSFVVKFVYRLASVKSTVT